MGHPTLNHSPAGNTVGEPSDGRATLASANADGSRWWRRCEPLSGCRLTAAVLFCVLATIGPEPAQSQVAVVEAMVEVEEVDALDFVDLPADPETAQLQKHLALQRALVRRVCKLTEQQEKKLESMDNKWLTKVSNEKEVVQQGAIQQPGLIGMFFGVRPQRPQVVKKQNVKKRIDQEMVGLLDEKQKEDFDKELKRRADFKASATADALIESLQDRLDLTVQQRVQLKKKLLPWVKRNPNLIATHYFTGNSYYPEIPLHLLAPLTNEQRQAYQGLQRYLFNDENFHDGNQPIVIKE